MVTGTTSQKKRFYFNNSFVREEVILLKFSTERERGKEEEMGRFIELTGLHNYRSLQVQNFQGRPAALRPGDDVAT